MGDGIESRAIRVGVSACLLGQRVRHDGEHKRDRLLTGTLGKLFEWVPVCPEVELGMGTPREPIHLVRQRKEVRLIGVCTGTDHTDAMREYARRRVETLADAAVCGYILKKDSPSCGLKRVRMHHGSGRVTRSGRGLFAAALIERFPTMPIEDEERLCDPAVRDSWVKRVFAYYRLNSRKTMRASFADGGQSRKKGSPPHCKDSGESDSMRSHEAGPGLRSRRSRRR